MAGFEKRFKLDPDNVTKARIEPALSRRNRKVSIITPTQRADLTERQREVLRLIAEGLTTKEIAAQLHLAQKTVTFYRTEIKERIGARGIAAMVRYAIRVGLIQA